MTEIVVPNAAQLAEMLAGIEMMRKELDEASRRACTAAREETAALNKLNAATKQFDAALKTFRETMPLTADWVVRDRSGGRNA